VRSLVAFVACAAILAIVNVSIVGKERLLDSGTRIYLELAPVDPRSLMQGDYMALRFGIADAARATLERAAPGNRFLAELDAADGRIIAGIDARGRASHRRVDDGQPLAGDEVYLRYRVRRGEIRFATNAFFFEEGTAGRYVNARYGEFRVAPDGELILTGLRGDDLEPL
jgi:uncharacterized membrane-anchored protein